MRKLFFMIVMVVSAFLINPFIVLADDTNFDFSSVVEDQVGEGWQWDATDKVLSLSGVTLEKTLTLPANSSIIVVADTVNSIISKDGNSIVTEGNLSILGDGTLSIVAPVDSTGVGFDTLAGVTNLLIDGVTLHTNGLTGLRAESVSIQNSNLVIEGYRYGIYATSTVVDQEVVVELMNCEGSITGKLLQGIEVFNKTSGNVGLYISDSNNLVISGNITNKKLSGSFDRSGVKVYTNGAYSNASVVIKDSQGIYFYGTNTGIAIDCHASDSSVIENSGRASLVIDNSMVKAETVTSTWAAFFCQ